MIVMKRKVIILNVIISLLLLIWFFVDWIIKKHPNTNIIVLLGLLNLFQQINIFINKTQSKK